MTTRTGAASAAETDFNFADYEKNLWEMADALRGSVDASEYKHVVLGLIFLKYISDAFEEHHAQLELKGEEGFGADPGRPRRVPRPQHILGATRRLDGPLCRIMPRQPDDRPHDRRRDDRHRTGQSRSLKDVLPKEYAQVLGATRHASEELSTWSATYEWATANARDQDVLGRVYEYFLGQFAILEGRRGGEFYTPRQVVRLLVEILQPYNGRVYDPCCGSSGMFVQSIEFIRSRQSGNGNGGRIRNDLSIYGQESNYTTWRLANMNLAIRGIEAQHRAW